MKHCQSVGDRDVPSKTSTVRPQAKVTPSGLRPSMSVRLTGSFVAGILALISARQMTSFSSSCRWWRRPALLRHDRQWVPLTSMVAPHGQSSFSLSFVPRRSPIMPTLTASSFNRKPSVEIGIAYNQSAKWAACDARMRARSCWSEHFSPGSVLHLVIVVSQITLLMCSNADGNNGLRQRLPISTEWHFGHTYESAWDNGYMWRKNPGDPTCP